MESVPATESPQEPAPPRDWRSEPRPKGIIGREAQEHRSAFDSRHMVLIDAMIGWQIANPGAPFSKMALALQRNSTTLRQLASTDAYKARFREVAPDLINTVGIIPLKAKIEAALEVGLERLQEKIAVSESLPDITDATEVLLKGMYGKDGGASASGPADGQTVQVNLAIMAGQQIMLGQQPPVQGTVGAPPEAPALEVAPPAGAE